ncbi:MAG: hypothetical protein JW894_16695 [Bacteroidales bacterium]|nr:hypothetical protein [Bacteroidales bacterium]
MMMVEVFIISVVVIGISFLALGVSIFFRRGGKFPETEIGHNKHMRELGIYCVKCDERKHWNQSVKKRKVKIEPEKLTLDLSELSS